MESPEWLGGMTPVELDEWETAAADADYAELMRAAERATARSSWPALARTIREMGGIDGLGQIARADVPGGLWRAGHGVAYDELPLALAAAGHTEYTEYDGDQLLGELRRAWDAWRDHQQAPRTAAAPAAFVLAGQRLAAPVDVAPLPEPDAADVDEAEALDAFGLMLPRPPVAPAPVPRGGDPEKIRRGLDALARPVIVRQRRARRIPDHVQRERDEVLYLERVAEEHERERAEGKARLRVVPAAPMRPGLPRAAATAGPRPVAPSPAPTTSPRTRALFVGAIAGTFALAALLAAVLGATVAGAEIPGVVWALVLSIPAAAAGVLPVALPARRAEIASLPAGARAERRAA